MADGAWGVGGWRQFEGYSRRRHKACPAPFPFLVVQLRLWDSLGSLQYVSHYCDSVFGAQWILPKHEYGHAGWALRSHRKGVEHWGPWNGWAKPPDHVTERDRATGCMWQLSAPWLPTINSTKGNNFIFRSIPDSQAYLYSDIPVQQSVCAHHRYNSNGGKGWIRYNMYYNYKENNTWWIYAKTHNIRNAEFTMSFCHRHPTIPF